LLHGSAEAGEIEGPWRAAAEGAEATEGHAAAVGQSEEGFLLVMFFLLLLPLGELLLGAGLSFEGGGEGKTFLPMPRPAARPRMEGAKPNIRASVAPMPMRSRGEVSLGADIAAMVANATSGA